MGRPKDDDQELNRMDFEGGRRLATVLPVEDTSPRGRTAGLSRGVAAVLLTALLFACNSDRRRDVVDAGSGVDGGPSDGGEEDATMADSGCDTFGIPGTECIQWCDDYRGWVGGDPAVDPCIYWCESGDACTTARPTCVSCTDEECGPEKSALFGLDASTCSDACKQCFFDDPVGACETCGNECMGYAGCREALGRYYACVVRRCAYECTECP